MPWKKIRNHSDYEIHSDGRVRSLFWDPPKILKPGLMSKGFWSVYLNQSTKLVHHLVLEAFVGKRPKGFYAHHKNGDTSNNRVSNLEWISHQEAMKHSQWSILTEEQVVEIKRLISEGHQPSYLARNFGVAKGTLNDIISKKSWRRIPQPTPRKHLSSHRQAVDNRWYTPGYVRQRDKECYGCGSEITIGELSWHDETTCKLHFCPFCLPCPVLEIRSPHNPH